MSEEKSEVSEFINKYFSYCYQNDQDIIAFQNKIDKAIHAYLDSEKISSDVLLENLTQHFVNSDIPTQPASLDSYMDFINGILLPNIVNVCKPSYLGHMTSMIPVFYQYLGQLITQLNMNVVKTETSKVLTLLERQSIAMLHRLVFQYPESFYQKCIQDQKTNMGLIVSGGTMANITALWIARNNALKEDSGFRGVQAEGMQKALKHYGYHDAVIIGSGLMHYSMEKLASLLGLGLENIIKIKLNESGAIDADELRKTVVHCKESKKLVIAIIGIAGTTETGKVDDLQSMAKIAKEYNIHFHVDAAWGCPILFSDKHKDILKGIESADTAIVCGHKQLYLPQGISVVLCKNPEQIDSIKFATRYQARKESFDLGKHSPEGSRPAFSLFLHAGLSLIGKKGYEYLIDEGIRKAAYLADLIKNNDAFELIEEPQTNIVVYRFIPEELREKCKKGMLTFEDNYVINSINEVLQDEQFHQGRTFISRSILRQTSYGDMDIVILRAVISNPMATEKEIEELLQDQMEIGRYILTKRQFSFPEVIKLLYQQTSSYYRQ